MKPNAILIGANAAECTRCAKALAERRGLSVLDFDGLVGYSLGRRVEDVLQLVGRAYYCKTLAKCAEGLNEYEGAAIVLSLPALAQADIFAAIARGGQTIVLAHAVKYERALIGAYCAENAGLTRGIKTAMIEGQKYWKKHADCLIACDGKDPEGIVSAAEEFYDRI